MTELAKGKLRFAKLRIPTRLNVRAKILDFNKDLSEGQIEIEAPYWVKGKHTFYWKFLKIGQRPCTLILYGMINNKTVRYQKMTGLSPQHFNDFEHVLNLIGPLLGDFVDSPAFLKELKKSEKETKR